MSLIYEALEKLEQEKQGLPKLILKPLSEGIRLERERVSKNFFEENSRLLYGIGGTLLFLFFTGLLYFLIQPSSVDRKFEKNAIPRSASSSFPHFIPSIPLFAENPSGFSLTGITRVGADWTAIVENQLVRVGDWVNGAQVKVIRKDEVILDWQGRMIALSLYTKRPAHFTTLENASS